MTPEQIAAIGSLVSLIDRMSNWPIMTLLFLIVIGPWIMSLILNSQNQKRFESVVKMYEDNVSLVKDYEKVACDLKDVLLLTVQTMTKLVERTER